MIFRTTLLLLLGLLAGGCETLPPGSCTVGVAFLEEEVRCTGCWLGNGTVVTVAHGMGSFPRSGYVGVLVADEKPKIVAFSTVVSGTEGPIGGGRMRATSWEQLLLEANEHVGDWVVLETEPLSDQFGGEVRFGHAEAGDRAAIMAFHPHDLRQLLSVGGVRDARGTVVAIDDEHWPSELFLVRLERGTVGRGSSGSPVFVRGGAGRGDWRLAGMHLGKVWLTADNEDGAYAMVRRLPIDGAPTSAASALPRK